MTGMCEATEGSESISHYQRRSVRSLLRYGAEPPVFHDADRPWAEWTCRKSKQRGNVWLGSPIRWQKTSRLRCGFKVSGVVRSPEWRLFPFEIQSGVAITNIFGDYTYTICLSYNKLDRRRESNRRLDPTELEEVDSRSFGHLSTVRIHRCRTHLRFGYRPTSQRFTCPQCYILANFFDSYSSHCYTNLGVLTLSPSELDRTTPNQPSEKAWKHTVLHWC